MAQCQVKVSSILCISTIDSSVSLMARDTSNGTSMTGSSVLLHGNIIDAYSSAPPMGLFVVVTDVKVTVVEATGDICPVSEDACF
jgi:hypothetical protein